MPAVERRRELSARRSGTLIWLCSIPEHRGVPEGCCRWCGEPIVLLDKNDYRRRQRTRHRGDEHEAGDRNCDSEFMKARAWNARQLIEKRDDTCCVDCGVTGYFVKCQGWWKGDGWA